MKSTVQPELPVKQVKFCANPNCYATFSANQKFCWRCGSEKTETMEVPLITTGETVLISVHPITS